MRKLGWPAAACFSRKHVFSENSVLHYDPRSPRTPHNSDCFDPKQTGNRNPAGCKTILQQTSASFQFLARDNLRQLSVHCENCCILYYVGLVLTRPLMLIISVKSILHPQCVTTASNWHRRTMNQYWDIKNCTIYLIGLKIHWYEVHTTLDVDFLSRLQIFISTSHIHLQIFIPITYLQLHICITYISRKLSILQDVYDSFKTMHSPISHMGLQQKSNTQFVAKHR